MNVKEFKKIVNDLPDYINEYDVVFGYCCAYCPIAAIEVGEKQVEISV